MKLGFDVDDTLINLREHVFHLFNKKLNKNIPIEVFRELETPTIHKPFGLTDVEGRQMWMDLIEDIYFTNCPPFPFAVEILQELEKEGHEIYYVTSRDGRYCERTKEWLRKAGFPVHDDRFFCGMQDPEKVRILKQIGVDCYFDDKPAVLETLMNSTVKVYVKNHPYNQHLDLPRIDSWSELKNILLKSDGK